MFYKDTNAHDFPFPTPTCGMNNLISHMHHCTQFSCNTS